MTMVMIFKVTFSYWWTTYWHLCKQIECSWPGERATLQVHAATISRYISSVRHCQLTAWCQTDTSSVSMRTEKPQWAAWFWWWQWRHFSHQNRNAELVPGNVCYLPSMEGTLKMHNMMRVQNTQFFAKCCTGSIISTNMSKLHNGESGRCTSYFKCWILWSMPIFMRIKTELVSIGKDAMKEAMASCPLMWLPVSPVKFGDCVDINSKYS